MFPEKYDILFALELITKTRSVQMRKRERFREPLVEKEVNLVIENIIGTTGVITVTKKAVEYMSLLITERIDSRTKKIEMNQMKNLTKLDK